MASAPVIDLDLDVEMHRLSLSLIKLSIYTNFLLGNNNNLDFQFFDSYIHKIYDILKFIKVFILVYMYIFVYNYST